MLGLRVGFFVTGSGEGAMLRILFDCREASVDVGTAGRVDSRQDPSLNDGDVDSGKVFVDSKRRLALLSPLWEIEASDRRRSKVTVVR